MPETKATLMRLGGRTLARLIKHVQATSDVIYEPADLPARLRATHPCIVACWHGQFMMLACLKPGDVKVAAMVARHGDAELIGEAMRHLDTDLIRGAGAGDRKRDRGGAAAVRAAVKTLTSDTSLVMTADIPPGPARVAGSGIITIARMSGCPIIPVAAATRRFLSFDTWSRMTLNLPYSTLVFAAGEPIHVPRDADATVVEVKRSELEAALNAATIAAYDRAGADINRATPLDHLAAISPPPPGAGLKFYAAAMSALRPAAGLFLNVRGQRGKEDVKRRGERLGFAGRPRPTGALIWVHAASVGETTSVLPLIAAMLDEQPDSHVLLTTGTTTSASLAELRLPSRAFHQYVPLDIPQYTRRFFDHWQPSLAIFTESDLWPNLILTAAGRSVPLVLVNARMSPRSMRRWRKNARIGRPLFSRFNLVLTQTNKIAATIKRLGAPNVITAGNLKIDSPPPPVDDAKREALRSAIGSRPVFFAASTHPGEEAHVAVAHQIVRRTLPDVLTIIAPRHPERGAAVAHAMMGQGLAVVRRSLEALPDAGCDVYVADTIGELGTLYAISRVALIGGSLIPHGGQNPIEAVRHGTTVLTGPHFHNFREAFDALIADDGAIVVTNGDEIARAVTRLLTDEKALEAMRRGATQALAELGGALQKTLTALHPFLAKLRA